MKTIRTTICNGVQTIFPVTFDLGYLDRTHIYVYVGDTPTNQVSYTWLNNNSIETTTVLPLGTKLNVRRITPRTLFNDYVNGAVLEEHNLDDSFKQGLMLLEEVYDGFMTLEDMWYVATDINMTGHRITNVGTPVSQFDATNKQYVDTHISRLGLQYPPITYAVGLTLDSFTKTYSYNGAIYIWVGDLGTVTTGDFDETGWQPIQSDMQWTRKLAEGSVNIGGYTISKRVLTLSSISELLAFIPYESGQQVNVVSYHNGWAATNYGPDGGGTFVATYGATEPVDGITIFQGAEPSLKWFRQYDDISIGMSGYRVGDDVGFYANKIITDFGPCDIHFKRGRHLVNTGIRLKRGCGIVGQSVFDNQSATVLVKSPSLNEPVIATEAYYGGINTHYYSINGICIEGNRTTKTLGAVRTPAVAWWGVFVGSVIDNLFILNNYGAGLSFEKSYDCSNGLVWINQCDVGIGAAVEVDQQLLNPGGPVGLLEFETLYTENCYIDGDGSNPKDDPSNRGAGIKVGNVYKLNIENLHQEGVSKGVHVTHGVNFLLRVGFHTATWCGSDTLTTGLYEFETNVSVVDIGPVRCANRTSLFKAVNCSSNLVAGNQLEQVDFSNSNWQGMFYSETAAMKKRHYNPVIRGNIERSVIGGASKTKNSVFTSSTINTRYHYDEGEGAFWKFGSRHSQTADKVFFRLESYGTAGDRVTNFVPTTIVEAESVAMTKALYVTAAGELRIRIGTGTFKVELTSV